jgi:hypothetical protein
VELRWESDLALEKERLRARPPSASPAEGIYLQAMSRPASHRSVRDPTLSVRRVPRAVGVLERPQLFTRADVCFALMRSSSRT